MKRTSIRESLKTSVFRDLPLKNARFAAQRARNCKGTAKNNRFLEVPIIFVSAVLVLVSFLGCTGNNAQNQVYASVASGGNELSMDNEVIEAAAPAQKPAVYFTADISPKGMMAVYNALNTKPKGKVAVKLSTGEPPKSNYLRPELIKDLVQSVQGTIVECNTAYGGKRASNAMHLQVAKDHGFTSIANFDLLDSEGEISLRVIGGEVLKENFVGSHFKNYNYYVVLSHFKGHGMAGFGGAIKNISIGIASASGKSWIHSGGNRKSGISGTQEDFNKSMAEAGKSVSDSLKGNILYVNVMNRLSIDCDCNGNPTEPDIHDIGILSSLDPVALDQACVDLIWKAKGNESMVRRIEARNGLLTLEHAQKIGLGSREYTLINLGPQ